MVPLMLQEETNLYCLSTFSNKLDQKQDLNFDNFNLLNEPNEKQHKAEWAMVVSPVNLFGKIDSHMVRR
jgi:hypothetical protein